MKIPRCKKCLRHLRDIGAGKYANVLSDDAIKTIWEGTFQLFPRIGCLIRLQLLTAQRSREVEAMQWGDINGGWWTVQPSGRVPLPSRVYMSGLALETLGQMAPPTSTWVFPVNLASGHIVRTGMAFHELGRICQTAFDFMDLRATAAVSMLALGVQRDVVAFLLGCSHSGDHPECAEGRSEPTCPVPPEEAVREALEGWERYLLSLGLSAFAANCTASKNVSSQPAVAQVADGVPTVRAYLPTKKRPNQLHGRPQERMVSDEEVKTLWEATFNLPPVWGEFARLSICTPQPHLHLAKMRWEDLDGSWWSRPDVPGIGRRVYLNSLAVATLGTIVREGPWVFRGGSADVHFTGPYKTLQGLGRLTGIRVNAHDLRRVAAAKMVKSGVAPYKVALALDFASPGVAPVKAVPASLVDESKKEALDAWAGCLSSLSCGPSSNRSGSR